MMDRENNMSKELDGNPGFSEVKDISIVSPVRDESENLRNLYERIKKSIPSDLTWELILIEDCSSDGSQEVIREICSEDSRVKAVFLSKQYSHQIALTVGYDFANGDVVISMDSDLQHPPEVIDEMLALWRKGNDIVFAVRKDYNNSSWFKKKASELYYKILKKISNVNLVDGAADFRLLDRKVVKYLRRYRETGRFIRGIVGDLGFKRTVLKYDEEKRGAGTSKYSSFKLFNLALSGVTSFSAFPLRLSTYAGVLISVFCALYSIAMIYDKIVNGIPVGLASITVGVFFLGGVQLISIGILGEYLSNVFSEVKRRPLYCVNEVINGDIV